MNISEWRKKHGTIDRGEDISMTAIIERHVVELE